MSTHTTNIRPIASAPSTAPAPEAAPQADGLMSLLNGPNWFDPLEAGLRAKLRGFIEALLEEELSAILARDRYVRKGEEAGAARGGYRHGHRGRELTTTLGQQNIAVPRARLFNEDGSSREWKSQSLRAYQRRTREVDALIASAYLSGTNTRRVKRALATLFKGAISKDIVSRTWRKVKTDWDAWNARDLSKENIVRLILDGTVVKTRVDRRATSISLLVALGVRADGQKILLAVKDMGGESEAAWRALLDDLAVRGLSAPDFIIVDGAPGLEKALAGLWPRVPIQRCTVHKHRNLLAKAPERLHEEISADYRDMMYAPTKDEVVKKRRHFIAKWRVKHAPVAASLEEAGDYLFSFLRLPPNQWKSVRTTNAIERLHEEFKRRIKTQTVLPCSETAAMLFWALVASGQITMRRVDGWETLPRPIAEPVALAA